MRRQMHTAASVVFAQRHAGTAPGCHRAAGSRWLACRAGSCAFARDREGTGDPHLLAVGPARRRGGATWGGWYNEVTHSMRLRVLYRNPAELIADHDQQFARGGLLVKTEPPKALELFSGV